MLQPRDAHERTTAKPVHIPTVLAVGCSDALLARCWEALTGAGVMIRDCAPDEAATLAALRRPLVILVAATLHSQDVVELEALARDVRGVLLRVDKNAGGCTLSTALVGAIRTARHRRAEQSPSERCSILPGELVPSSVSPPPASGVRHLALTPEDVEEELRIALQ